MIVSSSDGITYVFFCTGKLPEDLEKNQKDALRSKSKNCIFVMKRKLLTCRLVFATCKLCSSLVK